MANVERRESEDGRNIIEITVRFLLHQIKREDMDENNQTTLSYYVELMNEDPEFRKRVYARKEEITSDAKNGKRVPLYTDEELAKAKKHRRKKKTSNKENKDAFQPNLFEDTVQNSETAVSETAIDPEKRLTRLHGGMQSVFSWDKNRLIAEEVQRKKAELRNLIGLPVARGKDEHVNDEFYKFLVRRVVKYDIFGVFCEFDRVLAENSPELDSKINQVKGLIDELLNGRLNRRERFQKFHQFSKEYQEMWRGW